MKSNHTLSETLHKFQLDHNYSQHTMANLLGVSQSTYNNWINQRVEIAYKYYPVIARICQIDTYSVIPNDVTVQLASTPTMENPTTINALELYRTFTAPFVETIEILKKELKEKDVIIHGLQQQLKTYQSY